MFFVKFITRKMISDVSSKAKLVSYGFSHPQALVRGCDIGISTGVS